MATALFSSAAVGPPPPVDKEVDQDDNDPMDGHHGSQSKKRRKVVQIAEDRNETHQFVVGVGEGEQLLAQAEQQQRNGGGSGQQPLLLTVAGVMSASTALKRAIESNALARAKTASNAADTAEAAAAESYMESEIALYEQIAVFKSFAAAVDVAAIYRVLQQEVVSDFIQLLLHDNLDIATTVTTVLLEWLDPSLLVVDSTTTTTTDGDNNAQQERISAINASIAAVAATVLLEGAELFVDNLARHGVSVNNRNDDNSDEDDDDVGRGIDDILSLLENIIEIDGVYTAMEQKSIVHEKSARSSSAISVLCKETKFVSWIFTQLDNSSNNDDATRTPYRNRCMELLSYIAPKEEVYTIIMDWSHIPPYTSSYDDEDEKNKDTATRQSKQSGTKDNDDDVAKDDDGHLDGIEILLHCVATFRKRQPTNDVEVEFLENAGIVMASILTYSPRAVATFIDAQGIELVLRCLKERVYAGAITLKWLDMSGSDDSVYRRACEHMVAVGSLKYIFPLFLQRNMPKYYQGTTNTAAADKKSKREMVESIQATTIRVLYALIRHLREDSPHDAQARVLAKFVDDDSKDDRMNDNDDDSSTTNPKINRLIELLMLYDQRARLAEYKFFQSDAEERITSTSTNNKDETTDSIETLAALEAKLSAGGDVFHRLAAIAAFCCMGSKRCHEQILRALHNQGSGIGLICTALQEFVAILDESSDQRHLIQSYLKQMQSSS